MDAPRVQPFCFPALVESSKPYVRLWFSARARKTALEARALPTSFLGSKPRHGSAGLGQPGDTKIERLRRRRYVECAAEGTVGSGDITRQGLPSGKVGAGLNGVAVLD
jgi:hypothetical protein